MSLAEAVRARISDHACLVDDIRKGGCDATLAGAPQPRVIIDLDESGAPLGGATGKCDYLFFGDPDLVAAIEIKDHAAPNLARAIRQIQAGADAANTLTRPGVTVRFRPVLLSKAMRRDTQNALRKKRVRFGRREERVRHLICGTPLVEALGS